MRGSIGRDGTVIRCSEDLVHGGVCGRVTRTAAAAGREFLKHGT